LLLQLINELNIKYMANLAEPLAAEHWLSEHESETEDDEPPHLIFVGGSHAARMAAATEGLGYAHTDLSRPGLRISEEVVEDLSSELREAVASKEDSIVIFHMFDNNVFFAAGDDGSRCLPVKIGGRYHIPGRLEYADKTVVRKLVNTSAPLLRAAGQSRKYILSPLLRYLTKPCCEDKQHLTNRAEKKRFIKSMAARMRDIKDEIKDLVFRKRIRAYKVLSPNLLLLEGADEQEQAQSLTTLWDEDPVHLVEEKYELLVTALVERAKTETFTNMPATIHAKMPNSGSLKKIMPQHLQRQSWVTEDDTYAHRDYGQSSNWRGGRGRGRGGREGHGGCGGRGGRGGQHSNRGRARGWAHKQRGNRHTPY
jgi:hypothetical protein